MFKLFALALFAVQASATTYTCEIESRPDHKLNIEFSSTKTHHIYYEFPHTWEHGHEVVPLTSLYQEINGVRGEFFVNSCRRDENVFDARTQDYTIASDCMAHGIAVVVGLRFSPTYGGEFRYSKADGSVDSFTFGGCKPL